MTDILKTVRVDLREHAYSVFVGAGFLDSVGDRVLPFLRSKKVFIVTDDVVEKLYLKRVVDSFRRAGVEARAIVVEHGEKSKTLETAQRVMDQILDDGCDRKCAMVSLGGGVVGDLTGFCASLLLRGIDFIQIPTTLLAQTDSSIGGKTAVDARAGKNLIGTFHQPKAVFIDVDTLKTLDTRQMRAGFAEVAKYGLVLDADFWAWLEQNGDKVLDTDADACAFAVERCCAIKARVVADDEFELTGRRALLNFGHTLGHAIESASRMSVLHGEGVAAGCVFAAALSAETGECASDVAGKIADRFEKWRLPTHFNGYGAAELIPFMKKDKKASGGRLNFVLIKAVGNGFLKRDVDAVCVEKTLNAEGYV